jgi:hypothetical protein
LPDAILNYEEEHAMTISRSFILLLSVAFVFGCTVPSIEIVESNKNTFQEITDGKNTKINPEIPGLQKYRTFHTGTTGFISEERIRAGALKEIETFCAQKGNRPYLIEETTSIPPYILGNWQRIEILFSCVENTQ